MHKLKYFIITAAVLIPLLGYGHEAPLLFVGPYVGVNLGEGFGFSDYSTNPGCNPSSDNAVFCGEAPDPSVVNGVAVENAGKGTLHSSGFTGGIEAGYNWEKGHIVAGGEADFNALDFASSTTASGTFPFEFLGNSFTLTNAVSTSWLATIRGRLGVTIRPRLIIYATSGLAITDYRLSSGYQDNAVSTDFPGGSGNGNVSNIIPGWAIGSGTEWLITNHLSVKAEYLYLDFGSMSTLVPLSNTPDFRQTMHVTTALNASLLRIGLNYRF